MVVVAQCVKGWAAKQKALGSRPSAGQRQGNMGGGPGGQHPQSGSGPTCYRETSLLQLHLIPRRPKQEDEQNDRHR